MLKIIYTQDELSSRAKKWDEMIDWKFWSVISEIADDLPEGEYQLTSWTYKFEKRMKFPLDYKTYQSRGKRWRLYFPQGMPDAVRKKLKGRIWQYVFVKLQPSQYIEVVEKG